MSSKGLEGLGEAHAPRRARARRLRRGERSRSRKSRAASALPRPWANRRAASAGSATSGSLPAPPLRRSLVRPRRELRGGQSTVWKSANQPEILVNRSRGGRHRQGALLIAAVRIPGGRPESRQEASHA
jgi:hypothetical protein